MKQGIILASLFCAVLSAASALPESDIQFARANQDFAQGRFKEAIEGYTTIVRAGEWSAAVFYNLGNAYFRSGDFGRAILSYERALALDRQHPESAANLKIARDEARALQIQPGRLDHYLQMLSANQYTIAAAVAFWTGIFAIAGLIFGGERRLRRALSLTLLGLTIAGLTTFAAYRIDRNENSLGIVIGNDVTARLATAENAGSVLALPAGSEVRFLSHRGDWTYVELPNDQRGWIPEKDAERVRL